MLQHTDFLTQKPLGKLFGLPHDGAYGNYLDCDCRVIRTPEERPYPPFDTKTVYYLRPDLGSLELDYQNKPYRIVFVAAMSAIAVLDEVAFQVLQAYRSGLTVAALEAEIGQNVDKISRDLLKLGFISPFADARKQLSQGKEPLVAWVHVTNACNLDCSYCYIRKSEQEMSLETGKAVIDSLFRTARRHGYRQIVIKYAGGEPSLAMNLIEQLQAYAHSKKRPDENLRATLLSNGMGINQRKAQRIKALGLGLTISLDGLGKAHDQQRPTRNGKGSAAYVRRGIETALEVGLIPAISLTVTQNNSVELLSTVDWILSKDLPFNIHYYREANSETSQKAMRLGETALIENMRAVLHLLEERMPRRSLLNALVDYADLSQAHESNCLAGKSYLVYGHRGTVSACQMLMQQAVANTKTDDPLSIVRQEGKNIFYSVDEKEGCRDCEWRYWCAGGCPVQTLRVTGRSDIKSPYCPIYKSLFPEILRLEALRILHYGSEVLNHA